MKRQHFALGFLCFVLTIALVGRNSFTTAEAKEDQPKPPSFKEDIRPLLQAKCVRCHTGKAAKNELDLTTPAAILKGGLSGPAVEPGKPEQSLLYEKVQKGLMPPPSKKDPLAPNEVETIRRWIASGAKFDVAEGMEPAPVLTRHDVLPILMRRCTVCHG